MAAHKTVVIVTGGTQVSEQLLKSETQSCDYLIAADGGVKLLVKYGIRPDLIVGDFDSAPQAEWSNVFEQVPVVTFPVEKDYTDTELAVIEALKQPCERICILGGTGTRLDHTLANMMLLQRIEAGGRSGIILDAHNHISVLTEGEYEIPKGEWHYFSLVPLSKLLIVSLKDFKFPLDHARIAQASTVTISNEFEAEVGQVTIHEGGAFMILSRD